MGSNHSESVLARSLLIFAILLLTSVSYGQTTDAGRAWETLVAAKGGREQLYKVRNMLKDFDGMTELSVFPNLVWENADPWFGHRYAQIYDREHKLYIQATELLGEEYAKTEDDFDGVVCYQLMFLLETTWDGPTIVNLSSQKEGTQTFDVIETRIGKSRLDFGYLPDERLVRRVYFYNDKGFNWETWALDKFVDVDGIKMPTWLGSKSGYNPPRRQKFEGGPISFRFNVDYDPAIFDRPLRATSRDAWKKKS
jgi:hypothetical protein